MNILHLLVFLLLLHMVNRSSLLMDNQSLLHMVNLPHLLHMVNQVLEALHIQVQVHMAVLHLPVVMALGHMEILMGIILLRHMALLLIHTVPHHNNLQEILMVPFHNMLLLDLVHLMAFIKDQIPLLLLLLLLLLTVDTTSKLRVDTTSKLRVIHNKVKNLANIGVKDGVEWVKVVDLLMMVFPVQKLVLMLLFQEKFAGIGKRMEHVLWPTNVPLHTASQAME